MLLSLEILDVFNILTFLTIFLTFFIFKLILTSFLKKKNIFQKNLSQKTEFCQYLLYISNFFAV